jgi:hypothetical protein
MGNESRKRGPIVVAVMCIMMVTIAGGLTYFMHVSSAELVRNLDSPDAQKVGDSLINLHDRRDPAGIYKATELLKSDSTDIWPNATLYLGAMGKSQSIPYLIKAMQTNDPQYGREISVDLTTMTGMDFGEDFEQWRRWWTGKNPGTPFDFSNHLGK